MKKLGELLKDAGVLDEPGLQKALARQKQTGKKLGEVLVELNLVTEDAVFDALGQQLTIPIIGEQKLLLVEVSRAVLDLLTAEDAWSLHALPLLVDASRRQVAIVTSEPNEPRTVAGVRKATGIPGVKPYLAKTSAMRKVLTKHYGPNPATLAAMGTSPGMPSPGPTMDIPEELILEDDPENTADSLPAARPPSGAKPMPPQTPIARVGVAPAPPRPSAINSGMADNTASARARNAVKQKAIKRVIVADSSKSVAGNVKRSLEAEGYVVEVAHSPEEILNLVKGKSWDLVVVKGAIAENIGELERRVRAVYPMIEFRVVPSFATALMGDPVPYTRLADFAFEGFDLLLSLIERGNVAARQRAQTNARYAKIVAQRLMLPRKSVDEVFLAAYLDALGSIIVRQRGGDPGDRELSRRLALDLFRAINPPYDVDTVLGCVDERFDGSGARKMRGETIPIGARILAVVLGYADAKGMSREQVQKFLREMSGKIFDQRIVETFLQILKNEELLGDLGGVIESAGSVFLVDKDVAHTSTLELRLINEGYKVSVFLDGQAALENARTAPPALILAEIALPRMDGYNLLMALKGEAALSSIPFVFVSGKNDEFNQNKAMDLGADDFIPKPVNVEFLLKKLAKFLVKPKAAAVSSSGGVRGKLSDLGLIELIQTLSLGMKTAKLEISHSTQGVAALFLEEGRIVAANTRDVNGEEAFYVMATWTEGEFAILNGTKTTEKNVGVSIDFLILEALRRMDEAEAGISQDGKESVVTRK